MKSETETANTLKNAIADLKNSLVYQMSLGSRELFHSNIWAWLMKFDSRFINVFFEDYGEKKRPIKDGKIYREKDDFDISFYCVNSSSKVDEIFILENKIKSFITVDQLNKYTEKLSKNYDKEHIHAVYTGIKDSLTDEQRRNIKDADWKFLSYADIGAHIKELVNELQNELNPKDDEKKINQCRLIDAYADSIISMAKVLSDTLDSSDQFFTYDIDKSIAKDLEDLRLLDVYKKIKVADFAKHFRKNYYDKIVIPTSEGYVLDSWCGFSNKQPIFDIRFKRAVPSKSKDKLGKPIDKSIFEIGIQIQGDAYRFACLTMKETETKKDVNEQKDCFFDKICEHSDPKWFVEDLSNPLHGVELHKSTKNKKVLKYCSYEDRAADGYIFIYQYANVNKVVNGDVTYKNLSERINNDLEEAVVVINSLKSKSADLDTPNWVLSNL